MGFAALNRSYVSVSSRHAGSASLPDFDPEIHGDVPAAWTTGSSLVVTLLKKSKASDLSAAAPNTV
jgi:hypothetical protein